MPDREKVIKGLEELCEHLFHEYKICYRGDEEDVYNRFLIADNALALLKDQEAKTGKWIAQDGYDGDVYYDCSACGESWVMIEGTPQENGMRYCPHCGAKMEGR